MAQVGMSMKLHEVVSTTIRNVRECRDNRDETYYVVTVEIRFENNTYMDITLFSNSKDALSFERKAR